MPHLPPPLPPPPLQQPLPLPLPPPCPGQLQAEQLRLWRERPYWRAQFKTLADALAHPHSARVLAVCAAAALRARARQQTTKP